MVSSCKKDNDELDNPNGPWSVELTAECKSSYGPEFEIELAGTGTVTIDWGDGTVLENFQMPELKEEYDEEDGEWYEGAEYTHRYDKVGTYLVKVTGQDGAITLLGANNGDLSSLVLNHCSRLQYLYCYYNLLPSLDVSGCTQLKVLNCEVNLLTSLDVSKNTQLKQLHCRTNQLTSLDISKNTQLKYLECDDNELTLLDVSKNTQLEWLDCRDNELTALDVSKNTQLERLYCHWNKLTSLDISKNTQLKILECHENQLALLDVSKNTQLKRLECHENQLALLDVSNNTQLKGLSCYDNRLSVAAMNKIYNDLPVVGQGEGYLEVDKATAGDYQIAEEKGWWVVLR